MTVPAKGRPDVARAAAGMGGAAAVSRALGALRVLVVAAVLGTTYLGNAFSGSNSVSNVLFELLAAGALSAVLVPTFVRHLDAQDLTGAAQLARELLGIAVVVLGVVSVVGVLAAPWIADVLTATVADPTIRAQQQELSTFLLWFFIPQVVLYAWGAIATAVLHARRSFVVPAVAPIGNTVVMVACLLAFRVVAGADPGLELTLDEKLLLAAAGTLGVVAFVALPTIAAHRQGVTLVPSFARRHGALRELVALSGWAGLQHAVAAALLGAAIVAGAGVEGGVVAYQVGWFFFLAPYGIVAQPIHTAVLPELVADHAAGRQDLFAGGVRWALDSMAVLLLPLSALCVALALPAMSVLAFGEADTPAGIDLLAAAFAALTLGLLPYGAFFLLARAWYVLDDSRTPALAGLAGAVLGVAVMVLAALRAEGRVLVAALGIAHTLAFTLAAAVLLVRLRARVGSAVLSALPLGCAALAGAIGAAVWAAQRWWAPEGKGAQLVAVTVLSVTGLAIYTGALRLGGVSVIERLRAGGRPESA